MLEQAFVQVSQISVGVSSRSHPFIDLRQMHAIPWDFRRPARARSMTQGVCPPLTAMMKRPRSAIAARASAAINCGCLSGHRIGVCKYFNLHENDSRNAST